MNDPCRVLLICDDDLAGLELRGMLGNELRAAPVFGHGEPRTVPLEIEEVVLSGTWEIGVRDRHYHLGIVAVTGASPMAELARNPGLRGSLAATLYLVENGAEALAAGTLRPGRDRLLELPCTRAALLGEVEGMLLGALAQRALPSDDPRYLALVRALVGAEERSVRPLLAAADLHGWRYPQVLRHFGLGVDQGAVLERLVEHGICKRVIARRVRACPHCECHQLSYGEVCARCASVDFVRETIIHHFACAHMDTLQNFRQGEDLVCPKCRATLRQIGRDYEKPTGCYLCQSCSFIAAETRIQAHCLSCQAQIEPDQTIERLVYAYDLTPRADEAVAANDLAGPGMASVLRNQSTGLYAKGFFLFALERELERMRRYAAPVALVVVRSTRLEDLRGGGLDRYSEYVHAMWKAATDGLRTLDVACVWDEGVLAIMLPATPLAGAEVVAQRITERFRTAAAAPGADQELVIGTIQAGPDHADAEALVRDALGALSPHSTTASDVLVVEDDHAAEPAVRQS
jgi:hypothetical protein